jgi:DNA-binding CsgD family transcriptional regulator
MGAFIQAEDESISDELDEILMQFEKHSSTSEKAKEELEVLKLYRDRKTLKEISEITGNNAVKVKKQIDRSIDRLRRFTRKMEEGSLFDK